MTRRFYRVTGKVVTERPFAVVVECLTADGAFDHVTGGNVTLEPEHFVDAETVTTVVAEFADLDSEE